MLVDGGSIIIQKDTKELFKEPEYVKAAILTGCKNFSPVVKMDDHTIFCSDWGIKIVLKQEISDDVTHVGIRAHYFSLDKKENVNEIEVLEINEETFNNLIIFKFKHQLKNTEPLYWKVDKDIDVNKNTTSVSFSNSDVLLLK